jgi:hypothetical protein
MINNMNKTCPIHKKLRHLHAKKEKGLKIVFLK